MSISHNTPIIPRALLFGNPDKASAKISPDGQYISYLAPHNGVLNVWVGPAADVDAARPVTEDAERGIRFYGWAYTNQHILYIQDKGGDENWRIYIANLTTGRTTDLTPFDGVQARVEGISPHHPHELLISMNRRVPQLHDLYRVSLEGGEPELVLENDGFLGFVTDLDYAVRLGVRMTPEGDHQVLKRVGDGWEPFMHVDADDTLTTGPVGMNSQGTTLYLRDSRERDTAALFAVELASGERTLLAEDPRADAGATLVHPTEHHVQAVSFTYEREEWQVLDDAIADDLDFLEGVEDGELHVLERTLDDQTWLVSYAPDDGPVRYHQYDRQRRTTKFLFTNRHALEEQPLAPMHPVVIPSRDGLNMVSYYTLPVWSYDPERQPARPREPLPTVLLVHGGPWARDHWGFNSSHQFLANRGYAVLSVNFRSSTGFGKAFIRAGNLEWGRKMHDDLVDAVEWASEQGIADRERIAIMGGSYGGYATLAGLTFTPDLFACGVDIVGPSNLVTLLNSVPEYWKPMIKMMYQRVGDPTTEEGQALLHERSPLTHAHKIRKPLLIGQGANDPRVKQAESDQIVQSMQEKSIPVTYALYPDEGHGFARPQNSLSFMAVAEAFLSKHLEEERYEPIGDAVEGASLQVLTGAEDIPGLTETGIGAG